MYESGFGFSYNKSRFCVTRRVAPSRADVPLSREVRMITIPTTQNSLFDRVRQGGEEGRQALDEWYRVYQPVMIRIVNSLFFSLRDQAEDVVSQFVHTKALKGVLLTGYTPEPGQKFRSRLWVALRHHCLDTLDATRSRGTHVSFDENIDTLEAEVPDAFEIYWARHILGRAIREMKKECEQSNTLKGRRIWGVFRARFLPLLFNKPVVEYSTLVEQYGSSSPGFLQKYATDAKRLYAEALRSVVSKYTGIDGAQAELDDLWRIIGKMNRAKNARHPFRKGANPDKE